MGEKEITLSIQRTVQIFHRSACFRDEHFQANGNSRTKEIFRLVLSEEGVCVT